MPGDQLSTGRHEVLLPRLSTDLGAHVKAAEDSHAKLHPLQNHESERSVPASFCVSSHGDGPA